MRGRYGTGSSLLVVALCLLVADIARADEAAVERFVIAERGTVPIILSAPGWGDDPGG